MRFRVTGRHDSLLFAGLAFALLLVFQRSVQYLLDIATDIEHTYGVALVPALLILSVMFVFHLQANRREMRAEAAAAATEAALARAKAHELEQLMAFGQALSRTLTADALHETVWRHLPVLSKGADVWVLFRRDIDWERVTDRGHVRWKEGEIEAIADQVVRESPERLVRPDGVVFNGHLCYVILINGRAAGVVGTIAAGQAPDALRTIGTAATLLGIALRNVQLFAEVRDNGLKDGLTGCFNRSHGLERMEAELARSSRSEAPLSVLMFDIDRFKQINDVHGHPSGDAVLAALGHRLRQVLRRSDIRCRYGGDEFLVVLPDTGAAGAARVAECLRVELEQVHVNVGGISIKPAVSIGVATAQPNDSVTALMDRVDRALYAAKAAGRNCVRTAASHTRNAGSWRREAVSG
jgi:diguanylate cyclase (GGDEF)-like protein